MPEQHNNKDLKKIIAAGLATPFLLSFLAAGAIGIGRIFNQSGTLEKGDFLLNEPFHLIDGWGHVLTTPDEPYTMVVVRLNHIIGFICPYYIPGAGANQILGTTINWPMDNGNKAVYKIPLDTDETLVMVNIVSRMQDDDIHC